MSEFTVVKKQLSNYQALREMMSPELHEAFLSACLNAGLSEDDWIHCLFTFQAELFSGSLEAQMKVINKALTTTLSARQAENKQLSDLLAACQTSLQTSVSVIGKQAALSAEQIESLKKEIRQSQQDERKARWEEANQLQRQLEDLHRDLPDVRKTAALLSDIKERLFWWTVGLSIVSGAGLVILVQHLLGK